MKKMFILKLLMIINTFVVPSAGSSLQTTAAMVVAHGVTFGTSDVILVQSTEAPPLIVACGQKVQLPTAGLSEPEERTVNVNFSDTSSVRANCSWIVRPFSANSSNYFIYFAKEFEPPACETNSSLSFFDTDPSNGNLNYIGDWCSIQSSMVAGRQGFPTLITFTSPNVTWLISTLFYYGSYVIPEKECPETSMELTAGVNETSLYVASFFFWLPNGMRCHWIIKAPEKGVVNVRLWVTGPYFQPCLPNSSYFFLMDTGIPQMNQPLKVDVCDGRRPVLTHTSISGEVAVSFQSGDVGGSPEFKLEYWAEDMDSLCPTDRLRLEAKQGQINALKGVNQAIGRAADRDCKWGVVTAYDQGTVVKLINISNTDYLADCRNNDYLSLEGHSLPIQMCDNDVFPMWSKDFVTEIGFHADSRTPRREFIIYYTAVKSAKCQGRSVSLTATKETATLEESASPGSDTDGTDCRWDLHAVYSVDRVQMTVPVPAGVNWTCNMPWLTVFDDAGEGVKVSAPCQSTNTSLVYTNRYKSMLVVFNRKPELVDSSVGVVFKMSYVALQSSTGGGTSLTAGLSVRVWISVFILVSVMNRIM